MIRTINLTDLADARDNTYIAMNARDDWNHHALLDESLISRVADDLDLGDDDNLPPSGFTTSHSE